MRNPGYVSLYEHQGKVYAIQRSEVAVRQVLTVRAPRLLVRLVSAMTVRRGVNVSEWVRGVLENAIDDDVRAQVLAELDVTPELDATPDATPGLEELEGENGQ